MALPHGRKILLSFPRHPPRCISSVFLNKNCGRRNISHDDMTNSSKKCVQTVNSCYEKKRNFFHNNLNMPQALEVVAQSGGQIDTGQPRADIFLSAAPDEFHKTGPKCSACGVVFQTEDIEKKGFVPKKNFLEAVKKKTLFKLICHGCFDFRHYNKQTYPGVNRLEAIQQLQHLKNRKALIVYVVSLVDLEGTMLTNILELVGTKTRIIVAANKLDMIPRDGTKPHLQNQYMKESVKNLVLEHGLEDAQNFKDVCLLSCRTGYGIVKLVNMIRKHREDWMDVYLVGCANTGKSTLYNRIANLVNVNNVEHDLPADAIQHCVPGSTTSFIRTPISEGSLAKMTYQMAKEPEDDELLRVFNYDSELLDFLELSKGKQYWRYGDKSIKKEMPEMFTVQDPNVLKSRRMLGKGVELVKKRERQKRQNYLYDTPGILHPTQLPQYLSLKELGYINPDRWIVPRTLVIKPGYSIFIGGLAWLEFTNIYVPPKSIESVPTSASFSPRSDQLPILESIFVTVIVPPIFPLHPTRITEDNHETHKRLFLNNVLEIPKGNEENYQNLPKFKKQEYNIIGKGRNENSSDIYLHGLGWFSIAAFADSHVSLSVYTPHGVGQGLRVDPFLPYSVRHKHKRGKIYRGHMNKMFYNTTRAKTASFIDFRKQDLVLRGKRNPDAIEPIKLWMKRVQMRKGREALERRALLQLERIEQGVVFGKQAKIKEAEERIRLMTEESYAQLKGSEKKTLPVVEPF